MRYAFGYLVLFFVSSAFGLACHFLGLSLFAFVVLISVRPEYLKKEVHIFGGGVQLRDVRTWRDDFIADTCEALGLSPPTVTKRSDREGGDLWVTEGNVDGIQVGLSITEHGAVTIWSLLEGAAPPPLKLIREPPFAALARRAGAQDIQLGDRELDKRFLISGDTDTVRALLDQEDVHQGLVQLCRKYRSFYIENRRIEIYFYHKFRKRKRRGFRLQPTDPEEGRERIREGLDGLVQLATAIARVGVGTMPTDEEQSKIAIDPEKRFSLRMKEIQPGWSSLWLIVTLNALVFFGMFGQTSDGADQLTVAYDWGASFFPSLADGQWWRLITSNYVHFGVEHILFNMLFLLVVGVMIEALLGRMAFLFLYTMTGILAVLFSAWLNDAVLVVAGASGAVFGVYGAAAFFVFPRGDIVPVRVMRKHAVFMFGFIFYQLLAVRGSSGVDHWAHLGGFLSGYALATVLSHSLDAKGFASRPARLKKALAGASLVLALGVICFPGRPAELEELRTEASKLGSSYQDVEDQIFSIRVSLYQSNNSEEHRLQLAEVIRGEVVANHNEWLNAAEPMRGTFPKRWSNELEGLGFYVYEMLQGWLLALEGLEAGDSRVEEGLVKIEQARDSLYHP